MVAAARAIPEHTSSSFPLGVHREQEPHRLQSRLVSTFPPSLLTLFSRHKTESTERRPTPGDAPYFPQLNRPVSLLSLLTFLLFWKMLGPRSTVKSKQCKLWSWAASNSSQKLNLGLLLGEQEKVNTRSTFLFSLLLWAEDTREEGPTAFFQPFAAGSSAILAIRPLKTCKTLGSPIALETDVQGLVFQKHPPHYF